MKRFRMPKWFIAGSETHEPDPVKEVTQVMDLTWQPPGQVHRPVVEETKRKPRRLAPRKLLLVRRKDVVKFYMVGRRLQVLCINAEYREGYAQPDDAWFAIGMVVEQPATKLMIYDGPVFSMAGMDVEEKFSELRKQFPDYVFDGIHMTLSRKDEP